MFPSVLLGNWISSEKGTLKFTIIIQIANVCSPSVLRGNWIRSEKGTLEFTIILQIINVCSAVYSGVIGSALRKVP